MAICEASDRAMWFGTEGGVSRYSVDSGGWAGFTTTNDLADNHVRTICEYSESDIWFGTENGVSRFGDSFNEFIVENGHAPNDVRTIIAAGDGALWFGTWGNGVSRYQPDIWDTIDFGKDQPVQAIYESDGGAFWFGIGMREKGLYMRSNSQGHDYSRRVKGPVTTIIQSNDGAMWIGTMEGAIRHENINWTNFTTDDSELVDNHVWAICEKSSDSALWFGTDSGVSRYYNDNWYSFTTDSGLINNHVKAILEASDGALWFGTDSGLGCYRKGEWYPGPSEIELPDYHVRAICEASDGALWIGTTAGVTRFQDGISKIFTSGNGLADDSVRAIFEASDGAIWFATADGATRKYRNFWTTFTSIDGLANNDVRTVIEARDEKLWFGTGKGASQLKPDTVPPFTFIEQGQGDTTGSATSMFVFTGRDYRTELDQLLYAYAVVDASNTPDDNDWSDFQSLTAIQTPPLFNGTYKFYVSASDRWGNIDPTPDTKTFTVDITPPTLTIISPKQEQHIKGDFPIIGSAFDNSPSHDFDCYRLYYGSYNSETQQYEWRTDQFTNLKLNEVRNDTLGIFHTTSLQDGIYQVKLWAIDRLKHESEDKVLVIIDNTSPQVKITYPNIGDTLSNVVNIRLLF